MGEATSSADRAKPTSDVRAPSNVKETSTDMLRGKSAADTSVGAGAPPESQSGSPADDRQAPEPGEPSSRSTAQPLPFERLGHYEVVGRLGRGGMGEVLKGYERALDRHVAVKVLSPDLARDEEFVRRFHREAAAAARLVHPHVVQIFYIGEDQGHHFFGMQYVEGESLAERLDRQADPTIEESLALVEQLLSGLAAAHRIGLVHRDIKPGNLLIESAQDRLLLSDFGLVKSLSAGGHSTSAGVVMGTVDYIAPEQGAGQSVDARADLYSVGVLMYRLLGGRLPFEADSPTAVLFKHPYEIPQPLCEVRPDVPELLSELVDRLLSKSPDERPGSADELLAELRALRAHCTARGATPGDPADRGNSIVVEAPDFEEWEGPFGQSLAPAVDGWMRQAQDRLATMIRRHAPDFLQELRGDEGRMNDAVAMYERRRRRLRRLAEEGQDVLDEIAERVASHRRAAAAHSRRVRDADSAGESQRAAEEKDREMRLADQLEEQLERQRNELETMRTNLAKVNGTLAQLESRRAVLQARMRTADARARLAGGRLSTSPGRRRWLFAAGALFVLGIALLLALTAGGWSSRRNLDVTLYPEPFGGTPAAATPMTPAPTTTLTTGRPLECRPLDASVTSLRFAARSSDLFSASSDAPLRLWDISRGAEVRRIGQETPLALAPSPGGDVVATSSRYGAVQLWEVAGGKRLRQVTNHDPAKPLDIAYSPDGEFIAGISVLKLSLWNSETGREVRALLPSKFDEFTCLAWSRDGTRVMAGTRDGYLHVWEAATGRAVGVVDVTGREGPVDAVEPLADDRFCVTLHGARALVWNVQTAKQGLVLHDQPLALTCIASSPDGRFIFAGDEEGGVHAWGTLTGQRRHVFRPPTAGRVLHLAAAPVGNRLAAATADRRLYLWDLEDIGPESFENAAGMRLTLVPAGTAVLGWVSPGDPLAPGQGAPREVRIVQPFLMGAHEVTQGQFAHVMGRNPSRIRRGGGVPESLELSGRDTATFPVENVSWHDAAEFCNRLSAAEKLPPYYRIEKQVDSADGSKTVVEVLGGSGYRLPTEAEWECACRAGSTDSYPHGANENALSEYAWIEQRRTDEAGVRKPNGFGLFDMLGNVAEYAHADDALDEPALTEPASPAASEASTPRTGGGVVIRGGSAADGRDAIRPATRVAVENESVPRALTGFRVARDFAGFDAAPATSASTRTEPKR